jgi:hypothetical protein
MSSPPLLPVAVVAALANAPHPMRNKSHTFMHRGALRAELHVDPLWSCELSNAIRTSQNTVYPDFSSISEHERVEQKLVVITYNM